MKKLDYIILGYEKAIYKVEYEVLKDFEGVYYFSSDFDFNKQSKINKYQKFYAMVDIKTKLIICVSYKSKHDLLNEFEKRKNRYLEFIQTKAYEKTLQRSKQQIKDYKM